MASTSFDALMESAKEAGFGPDEPITPGTYTAEVVVSNTKLSAKGKRAFGAKFKIVGGPHDGSGVWWNVYLSPESPTALSITFRQLALLGADAAFLSGKDADDDSDAEAIADQLMGAVVKIKVINDGDYGNKVDGIYAASKKPAAAAASAPATERTTESRGAARPSSPF